METLSSKSNQEATPSSPQFVERPKSPAAISFPIESANLLSDICNPSSIQAIDCFLFQRTVIPFGAYFEQFTDSGSRM